MICKIILVIKLQKGEAVSSVRAEENALNEVVGSRTVDEWKRAGEI